MPLFCTAANKGAHNKTGEVFVIDNVTLILSYTMRQFTFAHISASLLSGCFLFACLFSSCSDDEQFTADKTATLEFSQDTISFDTVFANITTPTERLYVYNNHSKGVRIANVKLETGGTSGFLINVDGQNGTTINDIQVLKKDSIFVFIKLNAPLQASTKPQNISDAIIFTLESGVQQRVEIEACSMNADKLKGKVLEGNHIFTSDDTPRIIYDSLVVDENASLCVKEGTTLYFHNGASLIVRGELKLEGTLKRPVTIRGDRLDNMFDYLPYDRLENQWGGILLQPTCKGCTINHADIHSGNFGIICDSIEGKLDITNSVIHNVAGYGLYLKDSDALVANTQISNAKQDCVSIYGGASTFYHCTIAQFYPWDADRGNGLYVSNYINEDEHLITSADFYNCFITGYANDEVYGNPGEQELNLNFYNCVLLTDVSDETYFHDCTAESEELSTYKTSNFKTLDTHAYYYDFRLDSLSTAREKGSSAYSTLYPTDMQGVVRGEKPDAGCYQWQQEASR